MSDYIKYPHFADCTGDGSEKNPYRSADGTAGIGAAVAALGERGGRILLPNARYDISSTVKITGSSTRVSGEVWAYPADPNGVFEAPTGTKIRTNGSGFPAFEVGEDRAVGGSMITDLGVYGGIDGMDTRGFFDPANPTDRAGLTLRTVRVDQAEFDKLSFCGLGVGIAVCGNAEIDACNFARINCDGCDVGVYFAPRYSYYSRFHRIVLADTPSWGFLAGSSAGGENSIINLEVRETHFVRNGGGFRADAAHPAAAALLNVSYSIMRDCLFDNPGTFWYFAPDATANCQREKHKNPLTALFWQGNGNRITGNCFQNSSAAAMQICGNGNVLMQNVSDSDVILEGENNTVSGLCFTKPDAKLILKGAAAKTTELFAVSPARVVRMPA